MNVSPLPSPDQLAADIRGFASCTYCRLRGIAIADAPAQNRVQLLDVACTSIAFAIYDAMRTGTWNEKTYEKIGRSVVAIGRGSFVEKCGATAAITAGYIMELIAKRRFDDGLDRGAFEDEIMAAVAERKPKLAARALARSFV